MLYIIFVGGSDYDISAMKLLTFGPTNTVLSISIPIIDDNTYECTEMFQASLQFSDEPQDRVNFDPGEAIIRIFDDDGLCNYTMTVN